MQREDHENPPPMGGAWAEQQKQGMREQEQAQRSAERHPTLSEAEQRKLEEDVVRETEEEDSGEERTPDQVIGQVAHADGQKRRPGGAGEPEASRWSLKSRAALEDRDGHSFR